MLQIQAGYSHTSRQSGCFFLFIFISISLNNKNIEIFVAKKGLIYGKCCKNFKHFSPLFSNKMFVFKAEIHKMLVRIANREDPDQTASSEAV